MKYRLAFLAGFALCLLSAAVTIGALWWLCRTFAPQLDLLDSPEAAPYCYAGIPIVVILVFVIYSLCFRSGDIDDRYEQHYGERRS